MKGKKKKKVEKKVKIQNYRKHSSMETIEERFSKLFTIKKK